MSSLENVKILLKSLIKSTEFNEVVFQELLSSPSILPIEKEWFQYVRDVWQTTGTPPTEQLIEMQFPQLRQLPSFSEVNVLSQESLSVFLRTFMKDRQDQSLAKKLVELSIQISSSGLNQDIQEQVYDVLSTTVNTSNDTYENPFDTMRNRYEIRKTRPKGLRTYIQAVDEEIGGMNEGTLNTILGFTGSFKTTFATNIVYNNIVHDGYNIVLISLEMTKDEVISNLVCRHSYDSKFTQFPFISPKKLRNTELTEEQESFLFDVVKADFDNYKKNLIIYDQSDFTDASPLEIERKLEEADRELGHINAFIVDHIGLLKFSGEARKNEYETMNFYMRFFQGQCVNFLHKKRQVTGIVLVQANREGYLRAIRNDGEYDLRAIAEANEVERSSYRVFSVFSSEDLKLSKELKIGLIKHRGGSTISPPVNVFCEPDAYVIGDIQGFNQMMSPNEFSSMFSFEGGDLPW